MPGSYWDKEEVKVKQDKKATSRTALSVTQEKEKQLQHRGVRDKLYEMVPTPRDEVRGSTVRPSACAV